MPKSKEDRVNKSRIKFSDSWLLIPEFQSWLVGKSNHTAYCLICKTTLQLGSGKKDLLRHSQSGKHVRNFEAQMKKEKKEDGNCSSSEEDEGEEEADRGVVRWSKLKEYRDWAELIPDSLNTVSCKVCQATLRILSKNDMFRHAETEKHKRNMRRADADGEADADASKEPRTKFLSIHLTDPELSDWLIEHPPGSAYCQFCKMALKGHRNDFLKHSKSQKHLKNLENPQTEEQRPRKPYEKRQKEDPEESFHGFEELQAEESEESSDFEMSDEDDDVEMGRLSPSVPVATLQSGLKFRNEWLDDDRLCPWLVEKPPHIAYCSYCRIYLKVSSGKKDLLKHAETKKHMNNSNGFNIQPKIEQIVNPETGLADNILVTAEKADEENNAKTASEEKPQNPIPYRGVKFRKQWMAEPDFVDWLCEQAENAAFCKICNVYLSTGSGRKDLLRHKESAKHQKNEARLVKEQCRLCMVETDVKYMPSLFENDEVTEMKFYKKILMCTGIKLLKDKTLPNKICLHCAEKLHQAYQFRKLTWNTEKHFRTLLGKDVSMTMPVGKPVVKNEPLIINDDISRTDYEMLDETQMQMDDHHGDDDNGDDEEPPLPQMPMMKSEDDSEPKDEDSKELAYKKMKIRRHVRPKFEENLYVCEICGNHYTVKSKFTQHMKNHSDVKPYECEFCHKRFKQSSQMHVHIRIHTGEKPLSCQYCDRKFSSHSTKNKHEMVHRGERPFVCAECGKSFTYSTALKKHHLVHTGEKNFHCIPCGKSFPQKHNLVAHLRTQIHKETAERSVVTVTEVADPVIEVQEIVPVEVQVQDDNYMQFSISYIDQSGNLVTQT